KIYKSNCR
ncbi:hypothetical protein D030_4804B, partial [Vibrio parahaemolyticus AQ3810]